jgi:ribosomal protein S18 acetylase RimI-like enzyme
MDASIQSYLRAAVGHRELVRVGPFLAAFDRTIDHPYLSYAIPDDGAQPSAADVAALRAAFDARGRVARLEYLPAVAPAAEAALLAGGFAVEADLPLMTSAPGEVPELPVPDGVELVLAATDAELAAGGAVAHAAFGEPGEPSAAGVERTRRILDGGGLAVLAVAGAEPVGWGQTTPPLQGATELVGIAVSEAYRRRGTGSAITARLAREAFARGVRLAFLTPGDDGAERAYARAGFRPRTRMLHLRA